MQSGIPRNPARRRLMAAWAAQTHPAEVGGDGSAHGAVGGVGASSVVADDDADERAGTWDDELEGIGGGDAHGSGGVAGGLASAPGGAVGDDGDEEGDWAGDMAGVAGVGPQPEAAAAAEQLQLLANAVELAAELAADDDALGPDADAGGGAGEVEEAAGVADGSRLDGGDDGLGDEPMGDDVGAGAVSAATRNLAASMNKAWGPPGAKVYECRVNVDGKVVFLYPRHARAVARVPQLHQGLSLELPVPPLHPCTVSGPDAALPRVRHRAAGPLAERARRGGP